MFNCIVCQKPLEVLSWGSDRHPLDEPLPKQNIDDGCTLQIHRAYGSCHDMDMPNSELYYSVICDACITDRLANKTIRKFKYYSPPSGRYEEVLN